MSRQSESFSWAALADSVGEGGGQARAYHWSGVNDGTIPSSAAGCAGSIMGGCDGVAVSNSCATEKRSATNGYFPTKVTPDENPFYLDLPFDDVNDPTAFAERCTTIPWANDPGYAGHCADGSFSYMKNRWVKITGPSNSVCYGQLEDAGPSHGSLYHDANYVDGHHITWSFVDQVDVPAGPWTTIVTKSGVTE